MNDIISARTFWFSVSSLSVKVVVVMSVISMICEDAGIFVVNFSLSLRVFSVAWIGVVSVVKSHEIAIGFFVMMREDQSLFRCIISHRFLVYSRTKWNLDDFVC